VATRYSDVPEVSLTVPTLTAFAAMKTVAWMDRAAEQCLAAVRAGYAEALGW
jgi:hypothetical protein